MTDPMVHVIILNWNDVDSTVKCIESLKKTDYPEFLIRVVDNASSDDSDSVLSEIPDIIFKKNNVNLGYTGGNNKCISEAFFDGADYVWLVNNDVVVPPDCLKRLVEEGQKNPDLGLISPIIRNNDLEADVQFLCGRIDLSNGIYEYSSNNLEKARKIISDCDVARDPRGSVLFLQGTALLIKKNLFEKIGLLDESLFAYQEDNDYCIRAHLAGFRNMLVTDAFVLHAPSYGRARQPYYYYLLYRNNIIISKKYLAPKAFVKVLWWLYNRLPEETETLNPVSTEALLAGIWDGLLGRRGPFDSSRRMPKFFRRLLFNFGRQSSDSMTRAAPH